MSASCLPWRSTKREWERKKSAPNKGRVTSARRKFHLYVFDGKWRESACVPNVLIELPLAAKRGGPGYLVRVSRPMAGRTLTSAPVSMRNRLLEVAT